MKDKNLSIIKTVIVCSIMKRSIFAYDAKAKSTTNVLQFRFAPTDKYMKLTHHKNDGRGFQVGLFNFHNFDNLIEYLAHYPYHKSGK